VNKIPAAIQPYDRVVALSYVDGDEPLWREVAIAACSGLVDLVEKGRKALESREGPTLARVAHTLKGLCASLGAESTRIAALALESAARGAESSAQGAAFAELERRVLRLVSALEGDLRTP
jgi:HPt (histidine-containing phosphotransfer) domain-containing protein